VARDIPGVLDILFPRLSGSLVTSLNKTMFQFGGVEAVPDDLVEQSRLQHSMLFELAEVRAEKLLSGELVSDWGECLKSAIARQRQHFDAKLPEEISGIDIEIAEWSARNLIQMIKYVRGQYSNFELASSPRIPGLGWVASGVGDFSLGTILIEVKYSDRNFVAGDFRQILIYWLLKYAASLAGSGEIWSDCILMNPRRNAALWVKFDDLLRSASPGMSRVEAYEQLRVVIGSDFDRNQ
jgi:hypothetical protein